MSPILAIDTCLGAVSAALAWRDVEGRERTEEAWEPCRGGHAERLLPMIETLLHAGSLEASSIRRVAVTLGPGTFTGVRTGIATARAFALAAGAEVVGVTSLHAMALRLAQTATPLNAASRIAIVADARKGQVFAQEFDPDGVALSVPALQTYGEAAARLAGSRWRIGGSGAVAVQAAAAAQGIEIADIDAALEPIAAAILPLARTLPPLAHVTPLYIRPPDALPQAGKSLPRAGS